MAEAKPKELSPSRGYLDYLSNKFNTLSAKRTALGVYYDPINDECNKLVALIVSVKRQVMREDGIDDLKEVSPTEAVKELTYKVSEPEYEEA